MKNIENVLTLGEICSLEAVFAKCFEFEDLCFDDLDVTQLISLVEFQLHELHKCVVYSTVSKNDVMKAIFEDDIKTYEAILSKLS